MNETLCVPINASGQWRSHAGVCGCSNTRTFKKSTHTICPDPKSFFSVGGGYPSSRSIRLVGSAAHNYRSNLETRWSNVFYVDNNILKDGRTIDVSPCIVYNITHVTPSIKLVPIMWGKLCVWKMSLDPSAALSIHR